MLGKGTLSALIIGATSLLATNVAYGHGWVTNPPSRQDHCKNNRTSFDCGQVKYEPQSVEAPKGAMSCHGGSSFTILNDDSRPWPRTTISSTQSFNWFCTACHVTSNWEYFVDGVHKATFNGSGQPPVNIAHTLTGLPSGNHKILARWNIGDTPAAFYACIDVNVGGGGTATPTNPPRATATATARPGATATATSRSRATATPTSPARATATSTNPPPTPTSGGGTCAAAWSSSAVYTGGMAASRVCAGVNNNYTAAYWTQGNDPCTNSVPNTGDEWIKGATCGGGGGTATPTARPGSTATATAPARATATTAPTATPCGSCGSGGNISMAYFVQWGVYARQYFVKNIVSSNSHTKLTHINYAFGNVTGGACVLGDTYADYDMAYTAANSVDGVADTWDAGALRGSFNQLRKLKVKAPIKPIFSFGGWTWSGGFGQAAANASGFASSCWNVVEDARWADVFDGIDVDWEYPNACGLSCDSSGTAAFGNMISALRSRFGSGNLVTAAITADGNPGGKIDLGGYGGAAASGVNWYNVMTYDFFGGWAPAGPTAPHSALDCYSGIPTAGFCSRTAMSKLVSVGVPRSKLVLGVGFYGRGWTGVSQSAPGGSASGPAPGAYETGIEDYKILSTRGYALTNFAGTSYGFGGGQWWGYDTPSTIASKGAYQNSEGFGGMFAWELTGDTASGTLMNAVFNAR